MTYTFSCPAPCRRMIRIDARNDEDAVRKLIKAGAMTCRHRASDNTCETTRPFLTPWTDMQLRGVVRLIMRAEEFPETDSRVPGRVNGRPDPSTDMLRRY